MKERIVVWLKLINIYKWCVAILFVFFLGLYSEQVCWANVVDYRETTGYHVNRGDDCLETHAVNNITESLVEKFGRVAEMNLSGWTLSPSVQQDFNNDDSLGAVEINQYVEIKDASKVQFLSALTHVRSDIIADGSPAIKNGVHYGDYTAITKEFIQQVLYSAGFDGVTKYPASAWAGEHLPVYIFSKCNLDGYLARYKVNYYGFFCEYEQCHVITGISVQTRCSGFGNYPNGTDPFGESGWSTGYYHGYCDIDNKTFRHNHCYGHRNTYTVEFYKNSTSSSSGSMEVTYGVPKNLIAVETFGWKVDGQCYDTEQLWHAYRESDGTWAAKDKNGTMAWKKIGVINSSNGEWERMCYKDAASVSKSTTVHQDTIRMYCVWKKNPPKELKLQFKVNDNATHRAVRVGTYQLIDGYICDASKQRVTLTFRENDTKLTLPKVSSMATRVGFHTDASMAWSFMSYGGTRQYLAEGSNRGEAQLRALQNYIKKGEKTIDLMVHWQENELTFLFSANDSSGGKAVAQGDYEVSGNQRLASKQGQTCVQNFRYTQSELNLYNVTSFFKRNYYHVKSAEQAWYLMNGSRKVFLPETATKDTTVLNSLRNLIAKDSVEVVLYANWVENVLTIYYDANDKGSTELATAQTGYKLMSTSNRRVYQSSGKAVTKSYTYGTGMIDLLDATACCKRSGYEIVPSQAWLLPSGESFTQTASKTVTALEEYLISQNAEITLYMNWKKLPEKTFQIVYKPMGGNGTMEAVKAKIGEKVSLSSSAFQRMGYQSKESSAWYLYRTSDRTYWTGGTNGWKSETDISSGKYKKQAVKGTYATSNWTKIEGDIIEAQAVWTPNQLTIYYSSGDSERFPARTKSGFGIRKHSLSSRMLFQGENVISQTFKYNSNSFQAKYTSYQLVEGREGFELIRDSEWRVGSTGVIFGQGKITASSKLNTLRSLIQSSDASVVFYMNWKKKAQNKKNSFEIRHYVQNVDGKTYELNDTDVYSTEEESVNIEDILDTYQKNMGQGIPYAGFRLGSAPNTSGNFSKAKVCKVSQAPINLYYNRNKVTLRLFAEEGAGSPAYTKTFYYGQAQTLPTAEKLGISKNGYSFAGKWGKVYRSFDETYLAANSAGKRSWSTTAEISKSKLSYVSYNDGAVVSGTIAPSGQVDLYASWKKNADKAVCTVSYYLQDLDGGYSLAPDKTSAQGSVIKGTLTRTLSSKDKVIFASSTESQSMYRDIYTGFSYAYTKVNGRKMTEGVLKNGDIIEYYYNRNQIKLYFHETENSNPISYVQTVSYGSTIKLPSAQTLFGNKEGKAFVHWMKVYRSSTIQGKACKQYLTLNAKGANEWQTLPLSAGSSYRTYADESGMIGTIAPNGEVHLYGQWSDRQYQVRVDANGGSYEYYKYDSIGRIEKKMGTKAFRGIVVHGSSWAFSQQKEEASQNFVTKAAEVNPLIIALPVREGYRFAGWKADSTKASIQRTIVKGVEVYSVSTYEDTTITAQWKPEYTVRHFVQHLDAQGDEYFELTKVTECVEQLGERITAKSIYSTLPAGAYGDPGIQQAVIQEAGMEIDFYYYLIQYKIFYNLNDGEMEEVNPHLYTYDTPSFTLYEPKREGYVFEGWKGSNGTIPQKSVSIPIHSTGDREYIAVWRKADPNKKTKVTLKSGNGITSVSLDGRTYASQVTGTYPEGTEITLHARVQNSYIWSQWTGSFTSVQREYTFAVSGSEIVLTAQGQKAPPQTHTIYLYAGEGIDGVSLDGKTFSPVIEKAVEEGTPVTIYAKVQSGYDFGNWSGTQNFANVVQQFVMPNRDLELTAHAKRLTSLKLRAGTGILGVSADGVNYQKSLDMSVYTGTQVTIYARVIEGYTWKTWSGSFEETTQTYSFIMPDAGVTETAVATRYRTLSILSGEGIEGVSVNGKDYAGRMDVSIEIGTPVTIYAKPQKKNRFIGWSGSFSSASSMYTFTMPDEDITETARGEYDPNYKYSISLLAGAGTLVGFSSDAEKLMETAESSAQAGTKVQIYASIDTQYYQWNCWQSDSVTPKQVSATAQLVCFSFTMPEADVFLSAEAMQVYADYQISYYGQPLSLSKDWWEYDEMEVVTGKAKIGEKVSSPVKHYVGFQTPSSKTITLQADAEQNHIQLYYDRKTIHIIYHRNLSALDTCESKQELTFGQNGYFHTEETLTWTKTGYECLGWATSSQSQQMQYKVKDAVSSEMYETWFGKPLHLYAIWTPKKYHILLDDTDATVKGSTQTEAIYDANMTTITVPKRSYLVDFDYRSSSHQNYTDTAVYTFMGYYDEPGGNGTQYYKADGTSAHIWDKDIEGVILYAHWKEGSVALTQPERLGYYFDGWYEKRAEAVESEDFWYEVNITGYYPSYVYYTQDGVGNAGAWNLSPSDYASTRTKMLYAKTDRILVSKTDWDFDAMFSIFDEYLSYGYGRDEDESQELKDFRQYILDEIKSFGLDDFDYLNVQNIYVTPGKYSAEVAVTYLPELDDPRSPFYRLYAYSPGKITSEASYNDYANFVFYGGRFSEFEELKHDPVYDYSEVNFYFSGGGYSEMDTEQTNDLPLDRKNQTGVYYMNGSLYTKLLTGLGASPVVDLADPALALESLQKVPNNQTYVSNRYYSRKYSPTSDRIVTTRYQPKTGMYMELPFDACFSYKYAFVELKYDPSTEYDGFDRRVTLERYLLLLDPVTAFGSKENTEKKIEDYKKRGYKIIIGSEFTFKTWQQLYDEYASRKGFLENLDSIEYDVHVTFNPIPIDEINPRPEPENYIYKEEPERGDGQGRLIPYHDTFLFGKWSQGQYTIDYNLEGGTFEEGKANPTRYTVHTPTFTLHSPVRDGYLFLGWSRNQSDEIVPTVVIEQGSTGNRIYTAHWKKREVKYRVVHWKQIYGQDASVHDELHYQKALEEEKTARSGEYVSPETCDFLGYDAPVRQSVLLPEDGVFTIHYYYVLHQYQITYQYNGGTVVTENPSTYTIETPDITLINPNKEGFSFLGWSDGGWIQLEDLCKNQTIPKGSTGDLNFTAHWTMNQTDISQYKVRFISLKYLDATEEEGGFAQNSIWRTEEYRNLLRQVLSNERIDMQNAQVLAFGYKVTAPISGTGTWKNPPLQSWCFTAEDVKKVKQYVQEHGFGNCKQADALIKFQITFANCNKSG